MLSNGIIHPYPLHIPHPVLQYNQWASIKLRLVGEIAYSSTIRLMLGVEVVYTSGDIP